jgi:transcriptional regulator with XRE-family HTH domain
MPTTRKTLTQHREERKLSVPELGRQLNVDPERIRRLEDGRLIDLDLILKLAGNYGVPPEDVELSPRARVIKVAEHHYLIQHEGPNEARVTGITTRPPRQHGEDEDEAAFFPGMTLFNSDNRDWIETDPDPATAITRLADRIRAAAGGA